MRNDFFSPRLRTKLTRVSATAIAVAVMVAVLGLAPGSTSSVVGAQSVDSLRSAAARAADELSRMQNQSDQLNEQYLQMQEDIAKLKERQTANESEVQAAQLRLDQTRSEASSYLVEAYVGAGVNDKVVVGSSDPNEALNQKVLLSLLKGDRVELADNLEVSKSDLQSLKQDLNDTATRLEARRADQAKVVSQLESSVANQQQILNGANQQLNEAIRAEQERREAEAAARARAEAEQREARRQAEAQQAAAAQAARAAQPTAARQAPAAARQAPARGAASTPRRRSSSAPVAAPPAFTPPPAVSSPRSGAAGAIEAARGRMGTPYRWGGSTPAGFDCSGLMLWAWAQVGVSLPRTSGAQKSATQRISRDQLQPGDLVFSGSPVHHVGMYIGGGQMIHSPHTGDVVKISPVRGDSFGRIG